MGLIFDRYAMHVVHELRQIVEIAPKRIQLLARPINGDGTPHQDVPMAECQFTLVGYRIRILCGGQRRIIVRGMGKGACHWDVLVRPPLNAADAPDGLLSSVFDNSCRSLRNLACGANALTGPSAPSFRQMQNSLIAVEVGSGCTPVQCDLATAEGVAK